MAQVKAQPNVNHERRLPSAQAGKTDGHRSLTGKAIVESNGHGLFSFPLFWGCDLCYPDIHPRLYIRLCRELPLQDV